MWFCSSPFCIEHHSAKSSKVLISGRGVFIIRLIATLDRGISLLQHCFAGFAFSSQYWNTSCQAFLCNIWKLASWRFDCHYTGLRSIIALWGNTELAFKRLPSWQIWSEKWMRRWIISKLKSDVLTRGCAITDLIWISSWSTRQRFAAAERMFQVRSLSCSSWLCTSAKSGKCILSILSVLKDFESQVRV